MKLDEVVGGGGKALVLQSLLEVLVRKVCA